MLGFSKAVQDIDFLNTPYASQSTEGRAHFSYEHEKHANMPMHGRIVRRHDHSPPKTQTLITM